MACTRSIEIAIKDCRARARGNDHLMDKSGFGFGNAYRRISNRADRRGGKMLCWCNKSMLASLPIQHFVRSDWHADGVSHCLFICSRRGEHPAVWILHPGQVEFDFRLPGFPWRGCALMRVSMSSAFFAADSGTASSLEDAPEPVDAVAAFEVPLPWCPPASVSSAKVICGSRPSKTIAKNREPILA
jgi:hypothetical protein